MGRPGQARIAIEVDERVQHLNEVLLAREPSTILGDTKDTIHSCPFSCRKCGMLVTRPRKNRNRRVHRLMKCRSACDGIPRDLGGFPLDPKLRGRYKAAKRQMRSAKRVLKDLDGAYGFYGTPEWQGLRYLALKRDGGRCLACGTTERLHVDHVKPRSRYPELELELSNLQTLCEPCNLAKGSSDETDWRTKASGAEQSGVTGGGPTSGHAAAESGHPTPSTRGDASSLSESGHA